mgnify:CR=1 FL=1
MKYAIKPSQNQNGMVSITVTIVFIAVISLVVLGFSQITRRNSREALDRQLSSQAFYAAETGVNDAMNKIAKLIEAGQPVPKQTECNGSQYTVNNGRVGNEDDGVAYSCLLVDPEPPFLSYDNITDSSVIIPLNATEGNLEENTFEWTPTANPANGASLSRCPKPKTASSNPWTTLPRAQAWAENCPFGILRIELLRVDQGTLSDPIEAAKQSMVLFVYPSQGDVNNPRAVAYDGGSVPGNNIFGSGASQGKVEMGSCNDQVCKIKITGLNFANAYARVRTIYTNAENLQVHANGDNTFSRSQVVIDSTGRAQDVLRRVQVRMSLIGGSSRTNRNGFSDYALQTTDSICKRYEVSQTYAKDESGCSN